MLSENGVKQELAGLNKLFKSCMLLDSRFFFREFDRKVIDISGFLVLTLQTLAQQIICTDSDFDDISMVIFVQG